MHQRTGGVEQLDAVDAGVEERITEAQSLGQFPSLRQRSYVGGGCWTGTLIESFLIAISAKSGGRFNPCRGWANSPKL